MVNFNIDVIPEKEEGYNNFEISKILDIMERLQTPNMIISRTLPRVPLPVQKCNI